MALIRLRATVLPDGGTNALFGLQDRRPGKRSATGQSVSPINV